MLFKVRRFLTAVLVLSLLIQMHIAVNGYAARRTKIAFTSTRDGNTEIYVMDGDGENPRRLTVNPTNDGYPAWSPDGKKIAFVSNRNKGYIQIWVIDADGMNPVRLTDGVWDSNPDWSPDGTKIAYDTDLVPEGHNLAPGGIAVMDADGNNKRLLTEEGAHPSWSPDGKRIAFISSRNGKVNQLYVMDADGRNPEPLTNDAGHKRLPCWSPDGKRIAYLGIHHQIHVMDSDGENQRQLTRKLVGVSQPTWSPQSDAIAFESWGKAGELGIGIYLVDATSGAVNQVIHVPERWDYQPDWLYPGELAVSPAGSRITMWGSLKNSASSLR